jgi:hypothetical protein
VISGFCRDVDEICALLGYYAASSGNPFPTFRDNLSVQSSRIKKYKNNRDFKELTNEYTMMWYISTVMKEFSKFVDD